MRKGGRGTDQNLQGGAGTGWQYPLYKRYKPEKPNGTRRWGKKGNIGPAFPILNLKSYGRTQWNASRIQKSEIRVVTKVYVNHGGNTKLDKTERRYLPKNRQQRKSSISESFGRAGGGNGLKHSTAFKKLEARG